VKMHDDVRVPRSHKSQILTWLKIVAANHPLLVLCVGHGGPVFFLED